MKKVLVYGMSFNPGGVESVIINYYRHIDKSRVQFDFISSYKTLAYEQEIRENGGGIYKVNPTRKIKFRKQLKQIFQNNDYDAIWVNVCFANYIYLKYAKNFLQNMQLIFGHAGSLLENIFTRKKSETVINTKLSIMQLI